MGSSEGSRKRGKAMRHFREEKKKKSDRGKWDAPFKSLKIPYWQIFNHANCSRWTLVKTVANSGEGNHGNDQTVVAELLLEWSEMVCSMKQCSEVSKHCSQSSLEPEMAIQTTVACFLHQKCLGRERPPKMLALSHFPDVPVWTDLWGVGWGHSLASPNQPSDQDQYLL